MLLCWLYLSNDLFSVRKWWGYTLRRGNIISPWKNQGQDTSNIYATWTRHLPRCQLWTNHYIYYTLYFYELNQQPRCHTLPGHAEKPRLSKRWTEGMESIFDWLRKDVQESWFICASYPENKESSLSSQLYGHLRHILKVVVLKLEEAEFP